jgi:peptidylprolyl isomerase
MIKRFLIISLVSLSLNASTAVLETNKGNIEIKLFEKKAPLTTKNFKELIKSGYYNGVSFHRIIKDFMIQGGDPTGTGRGGQSIYGKKFQDEFSPKDSFNKPGIVAMANAGPNTNGSQFFITVVPTPYLNHKHTIFGEVIKGMDNVYKISNVKTSQRGRPYERIFIKKAYIKN